jgi:transcriptional regulator with XRE-family HTH domain
MDAAASLRAARHRAGLTQAALAQRAGTSQATISAYESGRKEPSVETLSRLLAAAGARLAVEPAATAVVRPSAASIARAGRTLVDVLLLAEALPSRHEPRLAFPRIAGSRPPAAGAAS